MWKKKAGRILRVFTPFTILLIGFLLVNYSIDDLPIFQQPSLPVKPEIIEPPERPTVSTSLTTNGATRPIATAIAYATEMPTLTPEATPKLIPTLLPMGILQLNGPPIESRFALTAPITFYWSANRQLSEGESFKLFFANDSIEKLVGTVSEPNLGTVYQINFIPESTGITAGDYSWSVKIIENASGSVLGESDRRSITLLEAEG